MRPEIRVLVVTCALLGFAGATRAMPGAVSSSLLRMARGQGSKGQLTRVIVELETGAIASPLSGDPAAARSARSAIRSMRETVIAELPPRASWSMHRSYETIPFVALAVDVQTLRSLERSGQVRSVRLDRLASPQLRSSVPRVRAPEAWQAGFDGSGLAIAILDSGTETSHPFLSGKVVYEACFTRNESCPNGTATQTGAGAGAACTYDTEGCSHGTHVAGVAAGRGDEFSGVARGANVVAIQVFSRFEGVECTSRNRTSPCPLSADSDQIAALEHVLERRAELSIAAVNMSLGGGRYASQTECDQDNPAMLAAITNLRAAGIGTTVSSGNDGFADAMGTPACISSAISVGATDSSDQVASFSDSAPFLTILAPGTGTSASGNGIFSSVPGGGFGLQEGTSQAAPHVAGALAILKQKNPAAPLADLLNALLQAGVATLDSRNGVSKPRIDIAAALAALGGGTARASGIQQTPDAKRILISKPVGDERWTITQNLDDETVTGNVFPASGGDPSFVYCTRTGDDGNADPYARIITLSCQGADKCTTSDCPAGGAWSLISDRVELPGSFFLPPRAGAGAALEAAAAMRSAPLGAAARASGIQQTPDAKRILISKPVGDQRWAITQNLDDQTVTGNVFPASGGDPSFVYCTRTGDDGNADPYARIITLSCQGADKCTTSDCPAGGAWSLISDRVELPGSFFLPPR